MAILNSKLNKIQEALKNFQNDNFEKHYQIKFEIFKGCKKGFKRDVLANILLPTECEVLLHVYQFFLMFHVIEDLLLKNYFLRDLCVSIKKFYIVIYQKFLPGKYPSEHISLPSPWRQKYNKIIEDKRKKRTNNSTTQETYTAAENTTLRVSNPEISATPLLSVSGMSFMSSGESELQQHNLETVPPFYDGASITSVSYYSIDGNLKRKADLTDEPPPSFSVVGEKKLKTDFGREIESKESFVNPEVIDFLSEFEFMQEELSSTNQAGSLMDKSPETGEETSAQNQEVFERQTQTSLSAEEILTTDENSTLEDAVLNFFQNQSSDDTLLPIQDSEMKDFLSIEVPSDETEKED